MATVLKGAYLIELGPPAVERSDLLVADGRIAARGLELASGEGDDVVDLTGRFIMPGLVTAHHHLHASLARGLALHGGFLHSELGLSSLQAALTGDEVEAAAAAGGLEALWSGTTTVFDVHRSPGDVAGSLTRVAHGLSEAGLRGALSYEVSDAAGPTGRDEALEESVAFLSRARGRMRGTLALGSLAGLSDESLAAVKAAAEQTDSLLLATVGEDPLEEPRSVATFGRTALARLAEAGLVNERLVLCQPVHLSWPELSEALSAGAWLVHGARSNMAREAGLATPAKFGVRGCLGTDVFPADVFAEAQTAVLRAKESGQPIDVLRFLASGHRLASQAFGEPVGPLREGALADLVVLDYHPATPVTPDNLAEHFTVGLSARHVESVMVDGLWRLWRRRPLGVEPAEVFARARAAGEAVARRLEEQQPLLEVAVEPQAVAEFGEPPADEAPPDEVPAEAPQLKAAAEVTSEPP